MSNFVSDRHRLPAPAEYRCVVPAQQERRIAIEDRRRILHPTPLVIGNGDHIKFPKGVLHAVPVVIELNRMCGYIEPEGCVLRLVRLSAHPNGDTVDPARKALPITNRQRH